MWLQCLPSKWDKHYSYLSLSAVSIDWIPWPDTIQN